MRRAWATVWMCVALLGAGSQAQAQGAEPPKQDEASPKEEPALPDFGDLDAVFEFITTWDGSADELQALYDRLPPDQRALLDGNFESYSLEGGLGLLGGYEPALGEDQDGGGRPRFRASLSFGAVWPRGKYALPIYYAIPDIPGPWALGFQGFAQTDNFDTFTGGATLRMAWEYIGTTPFLEVGPALRYHLDQGAAPGVHLELGYGNILFQGIVQVEAFFSDELPVSVMGGIRLPWLLYTVLAE